MVKDDYYEEHPSIRLMRKEHKAYLILFLVVYFVHPLISAVFIFNGAFGNLDEGEVGDPSAFFFLTFGPTLMAIVLIASRERVFNAIDDKQTVLPDKYAEVSWRYCLGSIGLGALGFIDGAVLFGVFGLLAMYIFAVVMWYRYMREQYGQPAAIVVLLSAIVLPLIAIARKSQE